MRKQTKLVAVASAAALLAIGASMTSFAATGWVEEDGQWFFYDKDGNRVEDTWKKSGDNWYWLDSEEGGAMAVDKLIDDDDNIYYVDANGVMVRNTWVKVVNEEQDDEDDPAEYNYYYMQSSGKAYKSSGSNTQFKTIDGKRYAFDEDGKMLYGWVDGDSNRVDADSWNTDGWYYLGNWDDGAMKTGWQKITVMDNDDNDEEKDFWFYFKSNGVKFVNDDLSEGAIKERKINGKRYGFDERGVMVFEWTVATADGGNTSSSSSWKYFNNPEDGARMTKGWFKVVAPDDDNDNTFQNYNENYGSFAGTDAYDETERWYYADGDGELYAGMIKKIGGKYYGFRPDDGAKGAAMLSGLVFMQTNNKGEITRVWDDNVDSDELDHIIKEEAYGDNVTADVYADPNTTLYYFGSTDNEDTDGSMKTGAVTVNLDGDSYNFLFSKTGGAEGKGKGVTGIDDEKYIYKYGMKIKAGSDDKFRVVKVTNTTGKSLDIASKGVEVMKVSSADIRNQAISLGTNKDGDSVEGVVYVGNDSVAKTWNESYYLVNTSGIISKKKTAARDGDDWYFYTNKDNNIVMYLNNKNYKGDDEHKMDYDLDNWDKVTGHSTDEDVDK